MLFIPGNNPGMIQNAGVLGADSLILDLEDAVSLSEKDSARTLVSKAIQCVDFRGAEVVVRINPLNSPFGLPDLEAMLEVEPDTLLIPKADLQQMQEVESFMAMFESQWSSDSEPESGQDSGADPENQPAFKPLKTRLIALVESAAGVEQIHDILKVSARTVGVLFGGEDYTSDMGIARTLGGEEIEYARNRVAVACKVHGVDAIDTPFTDVDNFEGLSEDARKAKGLGFAGKAAINPRQVQTIHQAFSPEKAEIRYALRVLEAMESAEAEGKGVFSLEGKMVDAPILQRAQQTVDMAEKLGLLKEGRVLL
jgi:citrate lyase subunit beta/citryl-CoA lyase